MLSIEHSLHTQGFDVIIGVDEAGRGPLAGPVVAGACFLTDTDFFNRIDDSKKLTALQRERAFDEIIAKSFYGLGVVNEKIIDRINILEATKVAMSQAVTELVVRNKLDTSRRMHVIVDGNARFDTPYPCTPIVRGDGCSLSIACASILAKVSRDRMMVVYDRMYPGYGFSQHKGYPTKKHRDAISERGVLDIHRKTFL
ncbi:MAG TPA: ribonuclease HII [Candidatus Omnitrophota bacterium]|nr:ribonuclease HII [Candidatus Omnitrophota bacterium]HPT06755.1 ribonuclease HII [Candidatus Omnitrophota bacterium]